MANRPQWPAGTPIVDDGRRMTTEFSRWLTNVTILDIAQDEALEDSLLSLGTLDARVDEIEERSLVGETATYAVDAPAPTLAAYARSAAGAMFGDYGTQAQGAVLARYSASADAVSASYGPDCAMITQARY